MQSFEILIQVLQAIGIGFFGALLGILTSPNPSFKTLIVFWAAGGALYLVEFYRRNRFSLFVGLFSQQMFWSFFTAIFLTALAMSFSQEPETRVITTVAGAAFLFAPVIHPFFESQSQ